MKIGKYFPAKQASLESRAPNNIPALLHQTFETTEIAPGMHAAAMTWINQNPSFEYRFYDNNDRRETISTHFAPDVLEAYDHIQHGAFRADLWRYCQLYIDGGVYVDLDSICKMPLQSLFSEEDTFISARAGNLEHAIYNGFICATPEHPFLKAAIDRAVALILESPNDFDGYMTTGPWNLGVAINTYLGRTEQHAYTIGSTKINGVPLRLLKKHSSTEEAPGYLSADDQPVLQTEYSGYRNDLKSVGVDHWQEEMRGTRLMTRVRRKVRRIFKRLFP